MYLFECKVRKNWAEYRMFNGESSMLGFTIFWRPLNAIFNP